MAKAKSTFDVFISHGRPDAGVSADVARVPRAYDLKVFTDAEVDDDQTMEDVIREAISESQAFVAIIPETNPTAWTTLELGAAKAWNKSIYAVAANPATARLPVGLQGMTIYPPSRVEEIAQEIKNASGLLSEADLAVLIGEYHRIGVSVDELLLEPTQLATLTKHFKKRTKPHVATEELMRALLRLRKQGKLRPSSTTKRPKAV